MVIGFKKQFVPLIVSGTKIHTLREDKNVRFKSGVTLHMATGVRTKDYKQFAQKTVHGVQGADILPATKRIKVYGVFNSVGENFILSEKQVEQFVKNDGFASQEEFWEWFNVPGYYHVIHWTDFRYRPEE